MKCLRTPRQGCEALITGLLLTVLAACGTSTAPATTQGQAPTAGASAADSETQRPTLVVSSSPAHGAYGVGATLDFQLTFSQPIVATGAPCLPLTIGSTERKACLTGSSSGTVLRFSYTITSGETDSDGIELGALLSLEGGSLLNSAGLAALPSLGASAGLLSAVTVNTSQTPPDALTAVLQTNLSDDRTSASFAWTAPAHNGTPITHYVVRYRKTGTLPYSYLSPNPTGTSATLIGLETGQNYEIQVAASNGVLGAYSAALAVSTVFNPASLGALLWFEARDIDGSGSPLADGTAVTHWVDKSGRGNNAAKIAGTSATIETVSGHKVVRLTSSGYRTLYSLGETANTDVEIYIVAKTRSVTAAFAFVNENEANANRFGSHFPWSDSVAYIDLPMGNRLFGNWGGNTSDFFAWTFRGSTTQGIALERNGTLLLNGGNRTLTPALKRWTIGSNYAGSSSFWVADLQAFFVFEKVLSTQQRTDFFEYIETNFGVDMP